MADVVVNGAVLKCDKGIAPCTMVVPPSNLVSVENQPVATVMEFTPANIPTFGMCMGTNSANPAVAAATSAAMGAPTPAPCVPVVTAPWSPGGKETKVGKASFKILTKDDTCNCMWTGSISVSSPGTTKSKVG